MKAIVVTDHGCGKARMKLVERPEPQAAINDVVVQVPPSQPRHCPGVTQPHAPSDDGISLSRHVGQSYDIAQREEDRVAVKFGRHPNDFMTSFYMRTPSDFLIEHGWGGRKLAPAGSPRAEIRR